MRIPAALPRARNHGRAFLGASLARITSAQVRLRRYRDADIEISRPKERPV